MSITQQIQQRIQTAKKQNNLSQLDLSQIVIKKITPQIKKIIQKCKDIQILHMEECSLTSLDNLPKLQKLIDLKISSNQITGKQLSKLNQYKNLISLDIANNTIKSTQQIKAIKSLSKLQNLQCGDNQVQKQKSYQKTLFSMFPKLISLNGFDKEGNALETNQSGLDDQEDDDYAENDEDEQQQESEKQEAPQKKQTALRTPKSKPQEENQGEQDEQGEDDEDEEQYDDEEQQQEEQEEQEQEQPPAKNVKRIKKA